MSLKTILFNPRSNASGKKILPMSLLALGALLDGTHEYVIVDGNVEREPLATLRAHVTAGADVMAVTVMPGPQLAQAVPICRALKTEFPQLTIIWGGYFPTQHADVCLRSDCVDFVLRGHAEVIFLQLLTARRAGSDYRTLAGLAYRDSGRIVQNPLPPIPHPEQMPDWNYERLDMAQYVRPTFLGARTLPHHSSYGCPFFCNFCAVVNMVNGRWLAQSPARVERVARTYVERWRVNAIEFYDNNFFTHEARTAEIAERLVPLRLAWWGEARIDTLLKYSERSWRLMRDAGLRMVFMGAESGSLETLKRMDKGGSMSPEKTLEIAARMKAYGIVPEFSFVLGSPPDPAADIQHTLEFIRRVKRVNAASEIVLYHYTPVPLAGDLYDAAQAQGFRFPATLDEWISGEWLSFAQRYSTQMPWLRAPLRQRIRNFERVLNAYYPTTTDTRLSGARRRLLRGASAWRYHARIYDFPLELRALQKIFHYQRPETSGF